MSLDQACAYWETAYYLLRRLLGWSDVGLGLQWWFAEGKPELGDARLTLLSRVFAADGHLETLALWAWAYGGTSQRSPEQFTGHAAWRAFQTKYADRPLSHDPFHGGSNALHLTSSTCNSLASEDGDALLLHTDKVERRATLLLNEASRWYGTLHQLGARLPDLGERSWQVEVVVRPIGWLGVFRRSRMTGEWFQGRHVVHSKGWTAYPAPS